MSILCIMFQGIYEHYAYSIYEHLIFIQNTTSRTGACIMSHMWYTNRMKFTPLARNIILFTVIIGTGVALILYYDSEQQKQLEEGETGATLQDLFSFRGEE